MARWQIQRYFGRYARLACLCLVLGSYGCRFMCASARCSVCVFNTCGMQISRLPCDALASQGRGRCGRRTALAHRNEHTKTNMQKRTYKQDEHVGMGLPLWHF